MLLAVRLTELSSYLQLQLAAVSGYFADILPSLWFEYEFDVLRVCCAFVGSIVTSEYVSAYVVCGIYLALFITKWHPKDPCSPTEVLQMSPCLLKSTWTLF